MSYNRTRKKPARNNSTNRICCVYQSKQFSILQGLVNQELISRRSTSNKPDYWSNWATACCFVYCWRQQHRSHKVPYNPMLQERHTLTSYLGIQHPKMFKINIPVVSSLFFHHIGEFLSLLLGYGGGWKYLGLKCFSPGVEVQIVVGVYDDGRQYINIINKRRYY